MLAGERRPLCDRTPASGEGGVRSCARPRPPIAGSAASTAGGSSRCESESGAGRGCRTSSERAWSSGSLAFSLAHPGCGRKRISAELAREKWGGLRISPNGICARLAPVRAHHPHSAPEPGRRLRRPLGELRRLDGVDAAAAGERAERGHTLNGRAPRLAAPCRTSGRSSASRRRLLEHGFGAVDEAAK
jgi:hypothetical protein